MLTYEEGLRPFNARFHFGQWNRLGGGFQQLEAIMTAATQALELPKTERTDVPTWVSWIARMQTRGAQAIARELERLRAAGLADDQGPLPLASLPDDMKPDSQS